MKEMKYFFVNFCIWTPLTLCMATTLGQKRFVVVTDMNTAIRFYPRIRSTRQSRFQNEPPIDLVSRKKICQDIFGSYQFARYEEYPYFESPTFLSYLLCRRYCQNYSTQVIEVFTYGYPEIITERVFPCLTQQRWKIRKYFVSEEYNLLSSGSPSTDSADYVAGRFVFRTWDNKPWTTLCNLAEESAKAFSSSRDIERLYHRRRAKSEVTNRSPIHDPLCKPSLLMRDKVRICVAVFTSSHFEGRIEYPPSSIGVVEGTCERITLSFRTEGGKQEAGDDVFEEWLMNCKPRESEDRFDYFISHAYRTNEIFVYFRENDTQQIFLENLSTNIRVP